MILLLLVGLKNILNFNFLYEQQKKKVNRGSIFGVVSETICRHIFFINFGLTTILFYFLSNNVFEISMLLKSFLQNFSKNSIPNVMILLCKTKAGCYHQK